MNKHIGSNFDDFLAEEAMLEEVSAVAARRVVVWQVANHAQERRKPKEAKTGQS